MENRYLFRAKRVDNGEWGTGYLYRLSESNPPFIMLINGKGESYEVNECTICQCTGLKDKNGKLIWENDIIKKDFYTDYDAYANSEAYTGRIQYEDGGWSVERTLSNGSICVSPIIDMIAYSKDIEQFEVIGNIFDNPELLNKRKETCCKEESKSDYER